MGHVHCDDPGSHAPAFGQVSTQDFRHLHYADTSYHEAMKQLELLADHIVKPGWDCPQCITKHALDAEAYAEEAVKLEGATVRHRNMAEKCRRIFRMVGARDWAPIPGMVREIRVKGP